MSPLFDVWMLVDMNHSIVGGSLVLSAHFLHVFSKDVR